MKVRVADQIRVALILVGILAISFGVALAPAIWKAL